MFRSRRLYILLLVSVLALAACQSTEEKAEGYYQSGLELLAKGDEERALVEFRNVFKYNGFHKEARKTYADIMLRRGNIKAAYSQYLRLIEQYPETLEVRQTLGELAFEAGNWPEMERHGRAAIELEPDDPRSKALDLMLDYREAVQNRDEPGRVAVVTRARALTEEAPESTLLRRIIIDHLLSGPDPLQAMPQVEAALKLDPESYIFLNMKLQLLSLTNDAVKVGEQLKLMVELFPERKELTQSLIRWYLSQGDHDGAEAFLRARAGDVNGDAEDHLAVVRFLNSVRSREVGRVELARLIEAAGDTPNADRYGAFLASMDYEDGEVDKAIATLDAILAKAEPSDQTRYVMALKARMHDAMGDHDKAEALVSQILEEDATNVDALKLRAGWAIDDDRPSAAIFDLRTAQGQAPLDVQVMTLLARAFERDGSLDLAGEQLAKAVEASRGAAEESLRYARFLRQRGREAVAETVLNDARRVSPGNMEVATALAEILMEARKWPEVEDLARALRQFSQPEMKQLAEQLDAAVLMSRDEINAGLDILNEQAIAGDGNVRSVFVAVSAQLRLGKTKIAENLLNEALAKSPDNPALRLLRANVDAALGRADKAKSAYRDLIEEFPRFDLPVRLLYGILRRQGYDADAEALLEKGLVAMPENSALLLIRAGRLEQEDDFEGAIRVYEKLYALDGSNIVVANNLASMLTSHRNDPESVERAYAVARRLRALDVPAFQDTYGWIEYRRGNLQAALEFLEPAAKGLPDDALTQFHLGMAYADLGRKADAIMQLQRALELAAGRNLPQMAVARARVAELQAGP
ncbi:MAG: tetratricopeptide repeat protein [Pseudorhodobacter sp.]